MGFRQSLASIAAVSLVVSPIAAQAAPREATPVEGEQLAGSPWIPIAVAFAVLAIILLVALDDNDNPQSP
jgi:hypothetical protein